MSGIAGILKGALCDEMLNQIIKRSPSQRGEHGQFISAQVSLFGCPQPIRGALGLQAYVLVCDGELYNKESLIKELRALGFQFADQRDATVMLHSFMAWGVNCLEKLLGVFAFALWDGERLFLARDRLGYKSLFYTVNGRGMAFASSMDILLRHPGIKPVLTAQGVAELMLLGPGRTPGCGILQGIDELKPGHYLTYRMGEAPEIHPYWQLKAIPHLETFAETAKTVRALLSEATGKSPTMLSGGLDSSILAALAGSKESFSLDYIGNDKHFTPNDFQPEDDNEYIKEMSASLRSRHRRHTIGTDALAEALFPAMEARGLPGMGDVDAALLLFCQNIRETTPVILSGEGADEIFGGYPWYTDEQRRNADTFPWSMNLPHRLAFLRPGALGNIDPEAYVHARFTQTMASAPTLYDDEPIDKRLRQLFVLNLQWFGQTLISRTECMSAAAGLTIRTPYLDHRLVEYLYNVPWAFKFHEEREKGLLREAFKGILPEKILLRKKSPFPKTHNPAYLLKVQDMMQNLLNTPGAPLFEFLERKGLNNDTPTPWYGQLMTRPQTLAYFLQINAWLERYAIDIAL
ncbi:MAG: asparagine synthase (glutamine-hydrolyzing) [Defluviitaleaceae bacterium]|nr:asparagine synthase (glutamine-hydrolyzing) [Defluviitaleaceae bacterium]MCL2240875.1 asparagine synthase (glutamine-hydrolyzing) [Defluviitaleaceae bacterium]